MCCFGSCSISARELEEETKEKDEVRIIECECCGGSYYKDENGNEVTVG